MFVLKRKDYLQNVSDSAYNKKKRLDNKCNVFDER